MRLPIVSVILFCLVSQHTEAQSDATPPPADLVAVASRSFHEYDSGNTIDQLDRSFTSPGPHSLLIARTYDPASGGAVLTEPGIYPNPYIKSKYQRASKVFIGIPVKRWSYPTVSGAFVFSIYAVRIEELVKGVPNSLPRIVYIARAGGNFDEGGRTIRAIDPEFHLFQLNVRYLFFGDEIASHMYKVDNDSSFQLVAGNIVETATKPRHANILRDRNESALINELRAVKAREELSK